MKFEHIPLVAAALLAAPHAAAERGPAFPYQSEPETGGEPAVVMPPPPVDPVPVDIQSPGFAFEVLVDPDTLEVIDGGLVRYTAVLRSRRGARNVVFEGIRCKSREYRTYAYGDGDGGFTQRTDSQWRFITDGGMDRYRSRLYEYYFCDGTLGARSLSDIRHRLRADWAPVMHDE